MILAALVCIFGTGRWIGWFISRGYGISSKYHSFEMKNLGHCKYYYRVIFDLILLMGFIIILLLIVIIIVRRICGDDGGF